ncbi:hypothetical protein A5636_18535 [Mycobacterium asiaticum]|uniref:Uncharacterized protein n=1 Tax=Mycobacterium asiaticum TaxID=1790 RepID=A0A1A3NC89_MYCAS|nr:hypothetical protein A5636_18535 [Mycobacterium asiaticum]
MVIRNCGQTPAYDIAIQMKPLDVSPYHNLITGEDVGVSNLYVPSHIPMLAPGQEWRTLWDSAVKRKQHADQLSDDDIVGDISFRDNMNDEPGKGRPYKSRIWINPGMFRNMLRLTEIEPSKQIASEIGKIASTISGYRDDEKPIWVYTLPGEREHQRREDKRADERRKLTEVHDHIISKLTPEEREQPRKKV